MGSISIRTCKCGWNDNENHSRNQGSVWLQQTSGFGTLGPQCSNAVGKLLFCISNDSFVLTKLNEKSFKHTSLQVSTNDTATENSVMTINSILVQRVLHHQAKASVWTAKVIANPKYIFLHGVLTPHFTWNRNVFPVHVASVPSSKGISPSYWETLERQDSTIQLPPKSRTHQSRYDIPCLWAGAAEWYRPAWSTELPHPD